jgi:phage terminase large subunit
MSDYIDLQPRQLEAYRYVGKGGRIFFGGSRGGGKTRLCRDASISCAVQLPGIKIVCIRETYPELEQAFIIDLETLYPPHVFGYKYRDKLRTAFFDNGSQIVFRACDSLKAAKKIMGLEYQLMIVDEANNFDIKTIDKLTGSLRNGKKALHNFTPTLLMTGNPGGMSDIYFKTRFVNPDYKRWSEQELKYKEEYIFVPSTLWDNEYVDKEDYVKKLGVMDDALREAWLNGNWDVFEGQFFIEWCEEAHVIPQFEIPEDWSRIGGIDLGHTTKHPTVFLKAAQDPKTLTLYIYDEYAEPGETELHIQAIKQINRGDEPQIIYSDPSMFTNANRSKVSDEDAAMMFLKEGIPLTKANNDRVNGWRIMKAWLHWTAKYKPKLQIMENCVGLRQTIPTLRYDLNKRVNSEDLDTTQADDYVDALRYLLVSGFGYPTESIIEYNDKFYRDKEEDEPIINVEDYRNIFMMQDVEEKDYKLTSLYLNKKIAENKMRQIWV